MITNLYKAPHRFLLRRFTKEGIAHYAKNIKWLTLWKVTASIFSLATTMIIARLFGPEKYGVLNYVMSITGMFGVIGSLGIGYLVYNELVKNKEGRLYILGNVISLTLIMGVFAFISVLSYSYYNHETPSTQLLIFILALSYFTAPLTYIHVDFLKDGESKYVAITQTITTLVSSAAKIVAAYVYSSLPLFLSVIVIENILTAATYLYQMHFIKRRSILFRSTRSGMSTYFIAALPLTALVFTSDLYSRIDQVILNNLTTSTSVGLYATAARLTEIWYIIPSILITAFFPSLALVQQSRNVTEYTKRLRLLSRLLLVIAGAIVLGIFLTSDYLITLIFGESFHGASGILRIYSLSLPGSFVTMLILHDLTIKEERWTMVALTAVIALINIGLCLILIPRTGAIGAAIATALSYNIGPFFYYATKRIAGKYTA